METLQIAPLRGVISPSAERTGTTTGSVETSSSGLLIIVIGLVVLSLLAVPVAETSSVPRDRSGSGTKIDKRLLPLSIPNDTCAAAVPLQVRQSVDGNLTGAVNDYELSGAGCYTGIGQSAVPGGGPEAVYSFTAPAANTYSFKVTGDPSGNFVLYTASTCPAATPGTPVTVTSCLNASNRNNPQGSEEVLCQSMASGQTVFIFVDQIIQGGTNFKIEVTICQFEVEPNSTPVTANQYVFGIEGSMNPGTDVDFYSLGASPAGQRVFALLDGSGANGTDFDLRVTTTTDTLEYDDDNASFLFGNVSPAIAGTSVTGVNTYLRVDSGAAIAREPYRLYAVVEPSIASAVSETEPNNSIGTANTNPLGYFRGTISPGPTGDLDVFSFTASVGDLVFIGLDNDPLRNATPFNGDVQLLDSAGAVLYAADDAAGTSNTTSGAGSLSSTTPFSPAEALVYRIQTNGTYYARVFSPSGTGDYLLAISRNGTPPTAAEGEITGRVSATDGSALAGVVVTLNGTITRRTITDSEGNYRFDGVAVNTFYTVTPARANYNFNPTSRSFSLVSNHAEAAFTAFPHSVPNQNPLDTSEYFVRQQYLDFLGREPDEGGFNYWSDQILACGSDRRCIDARRRDVAAAFFIEQEFQQTGSFIYGLYKGSLGRVPTYAEFSADRQQLIAGSNLETLKQALTASFVQRTDFVARYQTNSTAESFVDALIQNVAQTSGADLSSLRGSLVTRYNGGGGLVQSRSLVLRDLIDAVPFRQAEYNKAFVLSEYFGYLRRDPDPGGFAYWLDVLNNHDAGNYRGMVCAFITSSEYQLRFSSIVSRRNTDCGP